MCVRGCVNMCEGDEGWKFLHVRLWWHGNGFVAQILHVVPPVQSTWMVCLRSTSLL